MTDLGGRPRTIETPEEFDELVAQFIADCKIKKEPITWTGLALGLGFSSRQSIDEYQKYDGFSDSVKRAKLLVENAYEKKLHTGVAAGPIFALKNMQWKDKHEVENTNHNLDYDKMDVTNLDIQELEELERIIGKAAVTETSEGGTSST